MAKISKKEERNISSCQTPSLSVGVNQAIQGQNKGNAFPNAALRNPQGQHERAESFSGMTDDLVYHAGRHSFASLVTLEEGVPIETISRMLGHNNIQTTQIYARVTPQKLFEDMDKYIEATKDLKLIL